MAARTASARSASPLSASIELEGTDSLMPVPACLPFDVDTFEANADDDKVQFLTHAHKDHTVGIDGAATYLVCTKLTLTLMRIKHSTLASRIDASLVAVTVIEDGEELEFTAPARHGGYKYSVTALALNNHCPGGFCFGRSHTW